MARNTGYEYRERLGPDADGQPLARYLAKRYHHSNLEEWTQRCEHGLVLIDGAAANACMVARMGQNLVWRRPAWDEPAAPPFARVLFEDEDLAAVDKPAGLPTLPGANFLRSTLLHQVRERYPEASPLHRLGRWTSGVVLFARTPDARADLSRQWASRGIEKIYRALASGDPSWSETVVTVPIGPVPHSRIGTLQAAAADGKAARTEVSVVERRAEGFLCDVRITTGRPHQIRIHLAAAGHPLVGDPLYGMGGLPIPGTQALPGDAGYLLHAAELRFSHPRSGRRLAITSEPPVALERTGAIVSAPSSLSDRFSSTRS